VILGIGVDIVATARLGDALARFGTRFARRILTAAELRDFGAVSDQPAFLARRFAAKEAFSKALGTGFRQGLALRQIGVLHGEHGRPALALEGRAADLLARMGGHRVHLTLSDERDCAIAFVIIES